MIRKAKYLLGSLVTFAVPVLTFAVGNKEGTVTTISALIGTLSYYVTLLVPFVVGLAVLALAWGLFNFITSAGDEEARANAKNLIIWSIIAIFVMISIWGLVNILRTSFGFTDVNSPVITPGVPTV